MHKFVVVVIALIALVFAPGEASATKLTEQQVKNVCGGSMTTGGTSNATVSGCEKKCGTKICTYNCCKGSGCPGGSGCSGEVVGLVAGGGKTKANLPASVLKEIKAMSASPAGKKAPAAAAAAANTASMKTSTTTKIQATDPNRARLMKQETMKPRPATGAPAR